MPTELPENRIKKIKLPNNTEYTIAPEILQSNGFQASLPELTEDSIIALTSDIPAAYVVSSSYNSSTRKLTITPNSGTATEVTFGTNAFSSTVIPTSYIASVSASGNTLTITPNSGSAITYTPSFTDTNYYPTSFTWTNGTTSGPTGSLTGTGMSAVSVGAIPAAGQTQSGVVTTGDQVFAGRKTFTSPNIGSIYNVTKQGEVINFNFSSGTQGSGSEIVTQGHFVAYGDDDDTSPQKPTNSTGISDADTYYYNTGITIHDADEEEADINLQYPDTSGTLAVLGEIWKVIYPVGAVYISTVNTSPATLFGGTWEQISGRFLLAAGGNDANTTTNYGSIAPLDLSRTAGEKGGCVSHNHSADGTLRADINFSGNTLYYKSYSYSFTGNYGATVGGSEYSGSYSMGRAVDIEGNTGSTTMLPPYLVVYMWKRTA